MAIESDLKIFISWSGDLSREVMKVIRAWLPKMFDHIDPWGSDVDIEAGERGPNEIESRLNDSGFGIIVVTTENMDKPWLNFEAGALSKSLGSDSPRVVPLLVNLDSVYQIQGPISQFQAVRNLDRDGVSRLCRSIATVIGLDTALIGSRFEWAWPDLEVAIEQARKIAGVQPNAPEIDEKDLLTGLTKMLRSLDRKVTHLTNITNHNPDPFIVESGLGTNRRVLVSGTTRNLVDPWESSASMHQLQDEIRDYVEAKYRPVRSVSPMDWMGQTVLGVVFVDGEGMTSGTEDFNEFMAEVRHRWPISVAIVSDRDIRDGRAKLI